MPYGIRMRPIDAAHPRGWAATARLIKPPNPICIEEKREPAVGNEPFTGSTLLVHLELASVSAFSQGHAWVQENSPPFVAAGVGA
jgi:hypothetical protein